MIKFWGIFSLFRSEKCVCVVTYKVRRAFSLEGSFNKINKFISNLIMKSSSVKSRQIISKQTGRVEVSSLSLSNTSSGFLVDQNRFLTDLSYTFLQYLIQCNMFLIAVRHEVNNLESDVFIQELELAINLALFVLWRLGNQYNVGSLSWLSLALTSKCRAV